MSETLRSWARIAGLIAGPACWGLNTQLAYTVASQSCDAQRAILTPTMLTLIAISLVSALVSAFSARAIGAEWFDARGGLAHRFLATVSCMAGLLFAVVIANQFAALFILQKCLR